MDLQQWIAQDHAFVLGRFDSAISQHVPVEYWKGGSESEPVNESPTLAWLLFHMTYHQDLAINTAIRNHPPLLADHIDDLGIDHLPRWAGLTESENPDVTTALDLDRLVDYVRAVNARTSEWIDKLSIMALDSIPANSYRLANLAGIPADGEMSWLHAMWDHKPVSWLVQWECIGHGHGHVGEMVGIRNRLGLSPF